MLYQLVYISRRSPELSMSVLQQIVRSSEISNRQKNISGVLMCEGEHLMQLLEGEKETIQTLFERISKDLRHSEVQRLLLKPVKKRLFPEWGMGIADIDWKGSVNRERLQMLIDDISSRNNTVGLTVEARMLLSDFEQQMKMSQEGEMVSLAEKSGS